MSHSSELTDALDRCLTELQRGELSPDEVLQQFPSLAAQLRPLLITAATARAEGAPSGPSAAYRAQSKAMLMQRLRVRSKQSDRRPARRPLFQRLRPAFALGAVLVALMLFGTSVGIAYASDAALPGDSLYGVKLGMEQLVLTISPSAGGDTQLLLRIADRRVDELNGLLEAGRSDQLGYAIAGYRDAVNQAIQLAGSDGDRLQEVEGALSQQELALTAVLEQAAPQAAPAIEAALRHAQQGRNIVEQVKSGGSPSELAPGQLKKSGSETQDDLPPGQGNRPEGEQGDLPPGLLKRNACDFDHPGRGNPKKCQDQ